MNERDLLTGREIHRDNLGREYTEPAPFVREYRD